MSGGYQQAIAASISGAEVCFDPFLMPRPAGGRPGPPRRVKRARPLAHRGGQVDQGHPPVTAKEPQQQTLDQLAKLDEDQRPPSCSAAPPIRSLRPATRHAEVDECVSQGQGDEGHRISNGWATLAYNADTYTTLT